LTYRKADRPRDAYQQIKHARGGRDVYVLAAIDLHLRISGRNGDRESVRAPAQTRLGRRSGAVAER